MKSESKKIQGIVKELLSNSLNSEAKSINISIERDSSKTIIKVIDNGQGMDEEKLKYVTSVLKQPTRKDMEVYYEGLIGNNTEGDGLNLVGLLSDEAEITSSKEGTEVTIIRKNNNT